LFSFDKNKPIKIVYNTGIPPLKFNQNNKPTGMIIDIWKLWSKKTGIDIKFVEASWNDTLLMVKDGRADVHGGLYYTKDRDKFLDYTSKPLYENKNYFFHHKSIKDIFNDNDIQPYVVGIGNGYPSKFMKENYPTVKIEQYNSNDETIQAIKEGRIKVVLNSFAGFIYSLKSYGIDIDDFKYVKNTPAFVKKYFGAVKQGNIELLKVIDDGFSNISDNELTSIENKWTKELKDVDIKSSSFKLTKEEEKWLNKDIPIRYVYDPDWAPFEWKNDIGKHSGILHDILNVISKKSGLEFVQVGVDKWSDAVTKAKNKEVDMYSGINQTIEKEKYMRFTHKSVYTTPYVFVTRLDDKSDYFNTFSSLENKKVAVVDGYSIHDILKKEKPNLSIIALKSTKDGFEKLQNKQIDVFIVNAATAKYYINRLGFDELKISTKIEYSLNLKIAIRKDWPIEVISIIDKAMGEITQKELDDIYNKWTEIIIQEKTDWSVLLQIAGVAFLIILFISYNNRKLKQKVEEKTSELKKLLNSFDNNVIASRSDIKGNITYASKAFTKISEYSINELIGKPHSMIRHPDMPKKVFEDLWTTIQSGKVWTGEVKNKTKSGNSYWVESVISPEFDKDGKIVGFSAIRQDITAKKEVEELSKSLEQKVEERTYELNDERQYINSIMNSQPNIVISSDGKCLKTANEAFLRFFKVKNIDEFLERFGNCICDTFDTELPDEYIQKVVGDEKWLDYIYNRPNQIHKAKIIRDDKDYIFTITADKFEFKGIELKTAVFTEITELENIRKEIEQILSNILLPVLITSVKNRTIVYANEYAQIQYEKPIGEIIGSDIDDVYTIEGQHYHIVEAIKRDGFIANSEETFKTSTGNVFTALLSVTPIRYRGEDCYIGMVTDITKQKEMENEIRSIHKHTKESIEYASLIQGALIPERELFQKYFKDSFVIWSPKDIVGGDIYLFEDLRDNNECLLMYIDCTGHGVPGAFVTMLVKAIERQIVAKIEHNKDLDVSPAWILGYFNKKMKLLLKQDREDSLSNAGFDGGIIYYNKKNQVIKFAGAETSLFYTDCNGELKTIKGNRYSVGYKKCDINYEYKDHIIPVKEGMKFYCTTDGYLDQNGGVKDFPFGKKRFTNIIKEHYNENMAEQQTIFLYEMQEYEMQVPDNDRNDDMTVIGFEIGQTSKYKQLILEYDGELTQNIITSFMDVIEDKIDNLGISSKVSTVVIELTQNMMNYSKSIDEKCSKIVPYGSIKILDNYDEYIVQSRNIMNLIDKQKVEPKLIEINSLDESGIKKRYRELRRSGENTHEKGGGIGFYEIAKITQNIEYDFTDINKDKYYFDFKVVIPIKKR
jgi:polar amino acid transport system substrate-binding protein